MKAKLFLLVKSRTAWTVVITVLLNSVNANMQYIPHDAIPYVNGLLALAALYFKANPSQDYNPKA